MQHYEGLCHIDSYVWPWALFLLSFTLWSLWVLSNAQSFIWFLIFDVLNIFFALSLLTSLFSRWGWGMCWEWVPNCFLLIQIAHHRQQHFSRLQKRSVEFSWACSLPCWPPSSTPHTHTYYAHTSTPLPTLGHCLWGLIGTMFLIVRQLNGSGGLHCQAEWGQECSLGEPEWGLLEVRY